MKKTIYLLLLIALFSIPFFVEYRFHREDGTILGITFAAFVLLLISFRSTLCCTFDFDSMSKGSKFLYFLSFALLILGLRLITASDILWLKITGAAAAVAFFYVVMHIISLHTKV